MKKKNQNFYWGIRNGELKKIKTTFNLIAIQIKEIKNII